MMNISLRAWHPDDLQTLVGYANNAKIAQNLTNMFPHPYNEEAGKGFIAMANSHDPRRIFAIDLDGEAIGAIGVHPQTDIMCKNAEMGYWLAEPFWGKGIMSIAVVEMIGYGFKHFDISRIYARPFGPNIGSQKVLEKAGFVLEARFENTIYKNGVFMDELVYAVRRPA